MSWMDSWSRPRKDQAVPAPYYLTQAEAVKYCHTCGRVIGARRANAAKTSHAEVKYCSDKCKHRKPSTAAESVEKRTEAALISLLEGNAVEVSVNEDGQETLTVKAKYQPRKGDPRIIVQLSELEEAVFGSRQDPEKVFGRRKNRARRGVPDGPEWKSVDMVDGNASGPTERPQMIETHEEDETDSEGSSGDRFETNGTSLRVRPAQADSDVNFSVGGERGWAEKIEETPEMERKRLEGVKRAEEKEMVKQAARRAVVFGLPVQSRVSTSAGRGKRPKKKGQDLQDDTGNPSNRKCEALMNNAVVEPSFAKGDWSIRWREE